MLSNATAFVYVRRRSDDNLRAIIDLAEQCYRRSMADFVVIDMSHDETALSVLAKTGDAVRYLTVSSSLNAEALIQYSMDVTDTRVLILIDDSVPNIPLPVRPGCELKFVERCEFFAQSARPEQ